MTDYTAIRNRMIETQLRPSAVNDPLVLKAMAKVPREEFVPARLKGVAYADEDMEVAGGRYVMEPLVLARLLTAAGVNEKDLALVIGACTGYETAIIANIADAVVAIEEDGDLAGRAGETLFGLGVDNAAVLNSAHRDGCPDQGPYSLIFINGAVEDLPDGLAEQLKEGGRLAYVDRSDGNGRARVEIKCSGVLGGRNYFDAQTPVLRGFERQEEFVF